ncbi:hypothetical protein MBLNU230_g5312t1 [Neophaeotheca triangularis]
MSLAASFKSFSSENKAAAARNLAHSRPSNNTPARSGTPTGGKRDHGAAFSQPQAPQAQQQQPTDEPRTGSEIMTNVVASVNYLKDKAPQPVTFENLIGYLSLPVDLQKQVANIKRALQGNDRVIYLPKTAANPKESFRYKPLVPATNAEELREYLARLPTAQGLSVREIKDGWPDCTPTLDAMERSGSLLILRHKKDDSPRIVYPDQPSYHAVETSTKTTDGHTVTAVKPLDADFQDMWHKTKLPANENDIRLELEKNGLTPTSAVKEVQKGLGAGKKKRKVIRRGGKTTNTHMKDILKDYSGSRR